MKRMNLKKLAVPTIYLVAVITLIFSVYLIERLINREFFKSSDQVQYVDEEIINAPEYVPVINMDITLIKPFLSDNIAINKDFYDYKNPSPDAIIYYKDTYVQNTGIDYTSESAFDVVSSLDGTVINVEKNEILGNTIEIRHDNDLITLYQCVDNVKVKIDDTILRGQVIATSGACNLYNTGNNLHFEIYHNGLIVNPNEFFDKNILDIQ